MMVNNKKVTQPICDIVDSTEMVIEEGISLASNDHFSILLQSLMIKKTNNVFSSQLQLRANIH